MSDASAWHVGLVLTRPSRVAASAVVDGASVAVVKGSTRVTVSSVGKETDEDAVEEATRVANVILDQLSWQYDLALQLDAQTWSLERVQSSGEKTVTVKPRPATVVVRTQGPVVEIRDADGSVLQRHEPGQLGTLDVLCSEAAAYYRRAHLCDHPFDRFRYLYLAAENVAEKILTRSGFDDKSLTKHYNERSRDRSRLRLALDKSFGDDLGALRHRARALAITEVKGSNLTAAVAATLYDAFRCELFHSKASKTKKLPFNRRDEAQVQGAIPLMELVAKRLIQYDTKLAPW